MPFGWFFTVFGLVFAGIGVSLPVRAITTRQRQSSWTPTTATVRELETRRRTGENGTSTTLVAHYVYRDATGTEHTGSGPYTDTHVRLDGTPVSLPVVYDPFDPSRSVLTGQGAQIGCAAAIGCFFALIGLVFAGIGVAIATHG